MRLLDKNIVFAGYTAIITVHKLFIPVNVRNVTVPLEKTFRNKDITPKQSYTAALKKKVLIGIHIHYAVGKP